MIFPHFLLFQAVWVSANSTLDGKTDQCAINCIDNVNGTACDQSDWVCLCANTIYINRLNDCTVKSCNSTNQETTFEAIAEICAIFDKPLTETPEATFPVSPLLQNVSAVGPMSPTSMPAVTADGSDNGTVTSTAGSYTVQTSLPPSPMSTGATAGSTTANTVSQSSGSGVAPTTTITGGALASCSALHGCTVAGLVALVLSSWVF